MSILISIAIVVVGNVISYYITKWLDSKWR